jgi:hypothetical protein
MSDMSDPKLPAGNGGRGRAGRPNTAPPTRGGTPGKATPAPSKVQIGGPGGRGTPGRKTWPNLGK